jgi:ABC-type uncharacterized transport system ATPase subunit
LQDSSSQVKAGDVAVEMHQVTKRFPGVVANDHVDLEIRAGEVHTILGENGAGKTTLMNILFGLYQPDEGEIRIGGEKVVLRSPKDAIDLGIGMVHQQFMLIPTLSVAENIALVDRSSKGFLLDLKRVEKQISELSEKLGLKVDPRAKISQLAAGEKQRVEIVKALYCGARILILDEPTSVLTPPEVRDLAITLRKLTKEGLAVVAFITHKLPEVMEMSDRVTVLRKGRLVGTVETRSVNQKDLTKMMVGRETLLQLERFEGKEGKPVLEVRELSAMSDKGVPALKKVSFSIREGEILGIAGVAGNGQRELEEVLMGLRNAVSGKVLIHGEDLTNSSPERIIAQGVGYIPEDRTKKGVVPGASIAENLTLKICSQPPFAYQWFLPFRATWFLNEREIDKYVEELVHEYDIITPSKDAAARTLSGGNLQRLILARELSRHPAVILAAQPTGGLDVGATEFIRNKLIEAKAKGAAILLISEDLDEIMSTSDRIAVFYGGEIVGTFSAGEAKIETIGAMMAGIERTQGS